MTNLVPLPEAARTLNLSLRCLQRYVRERSMPTTLAPDGRTHLVNVDEVRAWIAKRGLGKIGRPHATDQLLAGGADDGDDKMPIATVRHVAAVARARKEVAEARLRELELKRRQGELVERAEVDRGNLARVIACRAGLMALPARLAPRLVGLDEDGIRRMVDREVRALLDEFAGKAP